MWIDSVMVTRGLTYFTANPNAGGSLTNGSTPAKVALNTAPQNPALDFSTASTRFNVATNDNGMPFSFVGSVGVVSLAAGKLARAYLYKNGSPWISGPASTSDGVSNTVASVSIPASALTAGDYVELWWSHTDSSQRAYATTDTYLSGARVQ